MGLAVGVQWGPVGAPWKSLCLKGAQSFGQASSTCLNRKRVRQCAKCNECKPLTDRYQDTGRSTARLPALRYWCDVRTSEPPSDITAQFWRTSLAQTMCSQLRPNMPRQATSGKHAILKTYALQGRKPLFPVPRDSGEKCRRRTVRYCTAVGPGCSSLAHGRGSRGGPREQPRFAHKTPKKASPD